MKHILSFLFIILFHQTTYPANSNLNLDLNEASLQDAIRLIAKFLDLNVILSPTIHGTVTLHLTHATPAHAFDLLLAAHDLSKWRIGNILLIGPRKDLIRKKQEELTWQDLKNASSELITKVWQINYGKADDLARLLKDNQASLISKRGHVQVDVRTNSICIQDVPEKIEEARRIIKRLDIPIKQIRIEARLASVDHDFERELGINFIAKQSSEENKESIKHNLANEAGRYSLAIVKLADGSLLDVKLSALESAGHAELISRPSLFTASHQAAWIEAGEEVPYQEVSESGGTAVVFKKAVLGLKVTPQALPGNKVLLQLQINQDRPSNKMVLGVPTISTRQITTQVLVKSGQTIVLGGIYEANRERGQKRVPFLSQVPLLGWLFKQENIREDKRELLIFITPKIISQADSIQAKISSHTSRTERLSVMTVKSAIFS